MEERQFVLLRRSARVETAPCSPCSSEHCFSYWQLLSTVQVKRSSSLSACCITLATLRWCTTISRTQTIADLVPRYTARTKALSITENKQCVVQPKRLRSTVLMVKINAKASPRILHCRRPRAQLYVDWAKPYVYVRHCQRPPFCECFCRCAARRCIQDGAMCSTGQTKQFRGAALQWVSSRHALNKAPIR